MFNEKIREAELLDSQVDNLKKDLDIEQSYTDAGAVSAVDACLDTLIGLYTSEKNRLTAVMVGIRHDNLDPTIKPGLGENEEE